MSLANFHSKFKLIHLESKSTDDSLQHEEIAGRYGVIEPGNCDLK